MFIKENGIDEVIPEAKRKRITFADSWKEFLLIYSNIYNHFVFLSIFARYAA